jgi:hypothetical protein
VWFHSFVLPPLRRLWRFVRPVFVLLDQALVAAAVPFGVRIQEPLPRYATLLGIYVVLYLIALVTPPAVALVALTFGYVGVLAVGRAWVANEKLRTDVVRKLANADPDTLPDLRGSALLSALQLLVLLPLLFQNLQKQFDLFDVPPGATSGRGWSSPSSPIARPCSSGWGRTLPTTTS